MTKLGINPGAQLFHLKVTLCGIEPPIWRRLLVPGNIRLDMLHETIQGAMGWKDSHVHEFVIKDFSYGDPDNPPHRRILSERGTKTKLKFLNLAPGDKFVYRYDPGDDWLHEILIEEISEPIAKETYPHLIDGARACPPEDCGGVPGYEHLLEVLRSMHHPEYQDIIEWIGGPFDPDFFDIKARRFIPIMLTYS